MEEIFLDDYGCAQKENLQIMKNASISHYVAYAKNNLHSNYFFSFFYQVCVGSLVKEHIIRVPK